MNRNEYNPGTVSKILWHFTGGPKWNIYDNKQEKTIKKHAICYDILLKIIDSKTIKLGNYVEVIKAQIKENHFVSTGGIAGPKEIYKPRKIESIDENIEYVIESSKVCCLTDIPLQHLQYHSYRYGKFAIGFYRNSIIKNSFNPVFYTFSNRGLAQIIHGLINSMKSVSDANEIIDYFLNNVRSSILEFNINDFFLEDQLKETFTQLQFQQQAISNIKNNFTELITFMKTISKNELDTIFCEREWRSSNEFNFQYEDIAMIIIPRKGKINYFDKFVNDTKLPRKIPVLPWEDIIE